MTPTKPDRFPYLSALRGLAALWVVMVHVAKMPSPALVLPWWLEPFVKSGIMGVNLFFLVSAFSLCLTMPKHENEARPYLGFLLRRFFRIAPLFYVMVVFTYFYNPAVFPYNWKTILANASFIFNFVPGYGYQTSIVLAGWTIGIEMAFYLLFPFIYVRTRSVLLALIGLIISLIAAWVFRSTIGFLVADPRSYILYSLFRAAPMFMFGIIAFYMVPIADRWKNKRAIGAALLASVPLQFYAIVKGAVLFGEASYWQGLMFGCLLIGLYLFPFKLLVNRATVWLGNISYSVYLVHSPIISHLFRDQKPFQGANLSQLEIFALTLGITLIYVIPIAALTFYAWENWINEWGKGFASRFAARKNVEPHLKRVGDQVTPATA
ncbi:acyltransferase family protein [Mesorhizobium calcicola]|uniref:Acyltransferase family protein n=1 Tax=Mesorhizobium calcicola TaxID=1300310 RepID=A0ABW4WJ14_9HYPH